MIWSTEDRDGGLLTWMPKTLLPSSCAICGGDISVSDSNVAGVAVELECSRGHNWINVLERLRRRIEG